MLQQELKREHSEISGLSVDSHGWPKCLKQNPSEADTIYYSETMVDAESLARAAKQAWELAEKPLPGKHGVLGKLAKACAKKKPAGPTGEISKSFRVIRLNSYTSKSYIRQKTERDKKTLWRSILNIQGPRHHTVAPAFFLICLKQRSQRTN